jgi:hypothetical protein
MSGPHLTLTQRRQPPNTLAIVQGSLTTVWTPLVEAPYGKGSQVGVRPCDTPSGDPMLPDGHPAVWWIIITPPRVLKR